MQFNHNRHDVKACRNFQKDSTMTGGLHG